MRLLKLSEPIWQVYLALLVFSGIFVVLLLIGIISDKVCMNLNEAAIAESQSYVAWISNVDLRSRRRGRPDYRVRVEYSNGGHFVESEFGDWVSSDTWRYIGENAKGAFASIPHVGSCINIYIHGGKVIVEPILYNGWLSEEIDYSRNMIFVILVFDIIIWVFIRVHDYDDERMG